MVLKMRMTLEEAIEQLSESSKRLEESSQKLSVATSRITELEAEVQRLKELLKTNSNNSSKPPSEDRQKKKKAKSSRRQGGQPGHKGTTRKLMDIHQVDKIEICELPTHCECGGVIKKRKKIVRRQVIDIPEKIKLKTTEYQLHKGVCKCCGKRHISQMPHGIGRHWFGKNIQTLLSVLVTRFKLSRRDGIELLNKLTGLNMSLGSVSNYEELTSQALEGSYKAIKEAVNSSHVINVDETGYKEKGKNKYAWVVASATHVLFKCGMGRGKKVAKSLIGENFAGTVISDRYVGYSWIPVDKRQVCWAHLKRDFTRISEREHESGRIGTA